MATGSKDGFNTASGKHCCNAAQVEVILMYIFVSIPQAVSTVATSIAASDSGRSLRFNTASGKHCCNQQQRSQELKARELFQYRKR